MFLFSKICSVFCGNLSEHVSVLNVFVSSGRIHSKYGTTTVSFSVMLVYRLRNRLIASYCNLIVVFTNLNS